MQSCRPRNDLSCVRPTLVVFFFARLLSLGACQRCAKKGNSLSDMSCPNATDSQGSTALPYHGQMATRNQSRLVISTKPFILYVISTSRPEVPICGFGFLCSPSTGALTSTDLVYRPSAVQLDRRPVPDMYLARANLVVLSCRFVSDLSHSQRVPDLWLSAPHGNPHFGSQCMLKL